MSNFNNEFNLNKPVGTDDANTLDTIIRLGVKQALAERYALEHVALDSNEAGANDSDNSNAQGRHKPGYVGCLLVDTTANILAVSEPPLGAIAYSSENAGFYVSEEVDGTNEFVLKGVLNSIYPLNTNEESFDATALLATDAYTDKEITLTPNYSGEVAIEIICAPSLLTLTSTKFELIIYQDEVSIYSTTLTNGSNYYGVFDYTRNVVGLTLGQEYTFKIRLKNKSVSSLYLPGYVNITEQI